MEGLSRSELQKLCLKYRASGRLPKGSKCNGSTASLTALLKDLGDPKVDQKHLIDPDEYENGFYSPLVLRSLAPYLSYDKLIEVAARYSQIPLVEELRDPNGKVWSDRVWVELGEPPVLIGDFGARYYDQWSNQSLQSWGEFVIYLGKGAKKELKTSIWASWASWDYNQRKTKEGVRTSFYLWIVTPQGLEFCSGRIYTSGVELFPEDIESELKKKKNWKLASPQRFRSLVADNTGTRATKCLALDNLGKFHLYSLSVSARIKEITIIDKILDFEPRVKYCRTPEPKNIGTQIDLYVVTESGEHLYLQMARDKDSPQLLVANLQLPGPQTYSVSQRIKTAQYEYLCFNPSIFGGNMVLPVFSQSGSVDYWFELIPIAHPGMRVDTLYLLPALDRIKNVYVSTKELYKSIPYEIIEYSIPYEIIEYYLQSTNGKIYKNKVTFNEKSRKTESKLILKKYPHRFSQYKVSARGSYGIIA